jgi:ATP-dependent helicase HrpB
VLANGRGAAVDQRSRAGARALYRVAELTGTAASGRILLAAPITQAEIEAAFADQIETADEIRSIAARWRLRRVARKLARHHALGSAVGAASPRRRPRRCWPMA